MIAIRGLKMPEDCSVCFGRAAIWCRFDESDRIVVPALPDELPEGRPDWCPMVEVPDMNNGNCSEFPNNSDCVSRQAAIDILEVAINDDWEFDYAKDRMIELSTQLEVIRCRDCAWSMTGDFSKKFFCSFEGGLEWAEPDRFCSYAERKNDG